MIVDAWRRRREVSEVRSALQVELGELQYRLAATVFNIQSGLGLLDKATLTWQRPIVAKYEGLNRSETLLAAIDQMLALPDDKITLLSQMSKTVEGRTIGLGKLSAHLLNSKLPLLSSMDNETQCRLLEVRAHLNFFNEEVDQARFFHQLTFKTDGSGNLHKQVMQTHKESLKNAASTARRVVDHIGKINW